MGLKKMDATVVEELSKIWRDYRWEENDEADSSWMTLSSTLFAKPS